MISQGTKKAPEALDSCLAMYVCLYAGYHVEIQPWEQTEDDRKGAPTDGQRIHPQT